MKKMSLFLIALLLIVATCMIPVSATTGESSTPALQFTYDFSDYSAETVEIDGVTYHVVYDADDFMDLVMDANTKYILADDITIDFTSDEIKNRATSPFDATSSGGNGECIALANDGSELYGNGKTLTVIGLVFEKPRSSLFGTTATASAFALYDLTVKGDVSFNSATDWGYGVLIGFIKQDGGLGNKGIKIQNVHLDNMTITANATMVGGMIGSVYKHGTGLNSIDIDFVNCSVSGTLRSTNTAAQANVGGFIGHAGYSATTLKCNLTFTNCSSDLDINSNGGRLGGFVGYSNTGVTLTMSDCKFNGTIANATSLQDVGSLVGHVKGTCKMERCVAGSANVTQPPFVGTEDKEVVYEECSLNAETVDNIQRECPHDYNDQTPVPENVGSHAVTCSLCGEKLLNGHTMGAYADNGDGKCSSSCTECGYKGIAKAHDVTTYTAQQDGTHKGTCTRCNATVTEEHSYNGKTCDLCGYEKSEVVTSADTTDGNDSEKSGCGATVGVAVASMVAMIAAGCVCLKKGKKAN